ncbi:hypothetical protein [Nocardia sp. NPDC127526]|uniref:hypothetical protein n=1 Tax=Nocardia sp. NPDC127526 TaxID=3345393 RepID=UPI003638DB18
MTSNPLYDEPAFTQRDILDIAYAFAHIPDTGLLFSEDQPPARVPSPADITDWLNRFAELRRQQITAERSETPKVYLMTVEHEEDGEYWGYTSAHRTDAGAKTKLHQKVAEQGVGELYDLGELEWSISVLPLED